MGTGKGGKYQLPGIRMPWIHLHLRTALAHLCDGLDIFNLQFRIDALREHVVGNVQDIHITGALSISQKRSLHALRAGQKRQLRSRNPGSPVIMRVQGNQYIFSVF